MWASILPLPAFAILIFIRLAKSGDHPFFPWSQGTKSLESSPTLDPTLQNLPLEIESAWELTGLYRGTPLTERSVTDSGRPPDLIFLYREPILLEWIETGEDLFRLVRNVLIHEIGHHFGFSDADITRLEDEG